MSFRQPDVADPEYLPFASIFNMTGQPAASISLRSSTEGLPIGVHFAARFGDEATLLKLASQLDQAQPWFGKQPALKAIRPRLD